MKGLGRRGYTMLVVMLLVAAASLFMLASMELGGGERLDEGTARNQQLARSIAEQGLARTTGYLNQLLLVDGDFDRALDPLLDDNCSSMTSITNSIEDHLPPFPDGFAVDAGAAPQLFMEVPESGGAYLVRIDDDSDDQSGVGKAWSTGNHVGLGCVEGTGVEDPVRDTNQTVIVTVIGIYPGTDPTHPQAMHTLRATVGPPPGPGLIAGGSVTLTGLATVSGAFDQVEVTSGNANLTNVGSAPNGNSGIVQAAGTCIAGGIPAPVCEANWVLPPAPPVYPWDVENAPLAAKSGVGEAFYYVRYDTTDITARLFAWNYGGAVCGSPRAFGRICYPDPKNGQIDLLAMVDGGSTRCASCWTQIYSGPTDAGVGHDVIKDPLTGFALFTATGAADRTSCTDPDPGASPRWPSTRWPGTVFTAGTTEALPLGVWFTEGSLSITNSLPGSTASLDVMGNIQISGGASVTLCPAAPRGYTLLAGKDLLLGGGSESIAACGGPSAVLVHEQLGIGGNNVINGEVVIADRATCDLTVTVPGNGALNGTGSMGLVNAYPGPIPLGPTVTALSWSDSAL